MKRFVRATIPLLTLAPKKDPPFEILVRRTGKKPLLKG